MRSGALHLRWLYIPLGPPVHTNTRQINNRPRLKPSKKKKKTKREKHTFVRTAIEAKEFPKFIPMTDCRDGISMGSCALPFGICPLRDILEF